MFCSNCGTQNGADAAFCVGCGTKLTAQQSVPVQQQYYQPPLQPMYQPYYYQPPAPVPGKGMGVAGMVLGIISIVMGLAWYISGPCAVVGLILSIVSTVKAKKAGGKNGCAVAGIVCSAVGILFAALFLTFVVAIYAELFNALNSELGGVYNYY